MEEKITTTIRAIVVPADSGPVSAVAIDNSDLGIYRILEAGLLDFVELPGQRAMLLCDEEGRLKRRPHNDRAGRIVERYVPGFLEVAIIAGPALVVGQDDDGEPTDLPPAVEADLLGKGGPT